MDAARNKLYIQVIMKRYRNVIGWEVLQGHTWHIHEDLDVALSTAAEGRRFLHYTGDMKINLPHWVLDYHFGQKTRFRTRYCAWRKRIPGTWHLYPPEVTWSQDTRAEKLPLHAVWIRFHGGEKFGLQRLVENPLHMARIHDPGGWLMERVRKLTMPGEMPGNEEYPRVLSGLTDIMDRLLHSQPLGNGEYTLEVPGESKPLDPLVVKINEYLVAHLHEPLTMDGLARTLHTSISTLQRHYAAAGAGTITQSLIRLRIGRVKRLLIEGCTAAEAADRTGFFDPCHLSRTFRHIEGIPPREFIARLRKTALPSTTSHQREAR